MGKKRKREKVIAKDSKIQSPLQKETASRSNLVTICLLPTITVKIKMVTRLPRAAFVRKKAPRVLTLAMSSLRFFSFPYLFPSFPGFLSFLASL
ncbi:MAG: hypothetical protein JXD23_00445 [Spirochaetales bacterium]|nr:hypothetical protein [Spirochaetales bacterium]